MKITLEVDDDDFRSIHEAITERQVLLRDKESIILPPGEGNLAGRIIGEICRDWLDGRRPDLY
jgi:hypothetical protein